MLLQSNEIQGEIVGIFHTINDGLSDVVAADDLKLIYGRDYVVEEILGLKFKISPFSFFQTNTLGAEKLYSIVREFVGDKRGIVFDLYSGTGTIAQILSLICEKVIGIEIVEEAVGKANENAKLNGLDNVEFIAGGDVLKAVDTLEEKPDLIIIDPPRDGIHPKAINKIIDFNPDTFIYVSCNPVTLVRDLKVFESRGYKVDKVKLMDMFPRTRHVETVVSLSHKKKQIVIST